MEVEYEKNNLLCLLIPLLTLTGCTNNSNTDGNDNLIPKFNYYKTFEDLKKHEAIMNSINPEDKIRYFDFKMDQYNTNYYIAGIDYENPNVAYENKHKIISDDLKTREIFYQLQNDNNDLIVTVVFKKEVPFNSSNIIWSDTKPKMGGLALNYEHDALGDDFYLMNEDVCLLALKFNNENVDTKIVNTFQNNLLEYFK